MSPDGQVVAYEGVEICGIVPKACVSTVFRSLSSGAQLIGKGLEMSNPTWSGDDVVGVVAGGVSFTGPTQSEQDWFTEPSPIPRTGTGTQAVAAVAASADATRLAVVTTPDSSGNRAVWLLTAAGRGEPPTAVCGYQIQSAAAHVTIAPDGSAIAVQTAPGITTMNVVDLTGTPAGCDANLATAKLAAAGGTYPSWSQAPYDPRPINSGPGGQGSGGNGTGGNGTGGNGAGGQGSGGSGPAGHGGAGQTTGGQAAHRASFSFGSRSLNRALGYGIRIRFSCPDGCTASAAARLDGRTSKHYRLGRGETIVAPKRTLKLERGAVGVLVLRFTNSASLRLRTARQVTVTVAITLRDASGPITARQKLTLR